jgi:ribosome maturation factor RimP
MTPTRPQHEPLHQDATPAGDADEAGFGSESGGRHVTSITLLESVVEPLVEDLGYELLLLEWVGAGKRRLMRLYIDSPAGVTIEDCTRLGRILSNALDARETAAGGGEGEAAEPAPRPSPALAALLGKPYTLEISSPGVDRPLTRRRHFADHVGSRVKLETLAPLEPGRAEKKFHGRIVAVEQDPAAPDDQRRGVVLVHDADGDRTLRIPLPRIRRANLVWEG